MIPTLFVNDEIPSISPGQLVNLFAGELDVTVGDWDEDAKHVNNGNQPRTHSDNK